MNNYLCPVCGEDTIELGEEIDVGIGYVKGGPDHCCNCGYIQQGLNPDDFSLEHYKQCWKLGIDPHPPHVETKHRVLKPEYVKWVKDNVVGSGYGKCLKTSQAMMKEFPELRLVRGKYFCFLWGERDHFWLIDNDGYIVDPTVLQFPTQTGHYEGTIVLSTSHLLK